MITELVIPNFNYYLINDNFTDTLKDISYILKKATIYKIKHNYSYYIFHKLFKDVDGSLANYFAQQFHLQHKYQSFFLVEPIHLQVNFSGLSIMNPDNLIIEKDIANNIINTINDYFKDDIHLSFIDNKLWLLSINTATKFLIDKSSYELINQNINEYLPKDIIFQKLFTEIQMILNQSNYFFKNKLKINSLWIWNKINKPNKNKTIIIFNDLLIEPYTKNYDINKNLNNLVNLIFKLSGNNHKKSRYLDIIIPYKSFSIKFRTSSFQKYKFWKNNQLIKIIKNFNEIKY